MTTYTIPRKHSPSPQKQPAKAFVSPVHATPPLYTVTRLDGSYCVTTVQGRKVQMRGPRWACLSWIEDNTFVEESA